MVHELPIRAVIPRALQGAVRAVVPVVAPALISTKQIDNGKMSGLHIPYVQMRVEKPFLQILFKGKIVKFSSEENRRRR